MFLLNCVYIPVFISLFVFMFYFGVSAASESESDSSPEKRARVGEMPGAEESSSSSSSSSSCSASSSSSASSRGGSKQRSRKRCHRCQTKLELVQQELGSCRCGTTKQPQERTFRILSWHVEVCELKCTCNCFNYDWTASATSVNW